LTYLQLEFGNNGYAFINGGFFERDAAGREEEEEKVLEMTKLSLLNHPSSFKL